MQRQHLSLLVALTSAALVATSATGQQRGPFQVLAAKVCELGRATEKDQLFGPLGLAPFLFVGEPDDSGLAVSVSTCRDLLPRADAPFLGIRHFVDATAPGESIFMDYYVVSESGESIAGFRLNLTAKLIIRADVAAPAWRQQLRDLESYWLNKYGLRGQ